VAADSPSVSTKQAPEHETGAGQPVQAAVPGERTGVRVQPQCLLELLGPPEQQAAQHRQQQADAQPADHVFTGVAGEQLVVQFGQPREQTFLGRLLAQQRAVGGIDPQHPLRAVAARAGFDRLAGFAETQRQVG